MGIAPTTVKASGSSKMKLETLVDWFSHFRSCIVAFSAGVDSSLLALASRKALGQNAYAVTSTSPAFSYSELEAARNTAKEIGIPLIEVEQNDLMDENYIQNNVRRCYFCRRNLADAVRPIANRLSIEVCVDGTHVEDMQSPRPGIKALRDSGFRAPLLELEFTMVEIREVARFAGLSNWNRPSEASLSSRIAYEHPIDFNALRRVEAAEREVKTLTGARIVRVRTIGRRAVVEVDRESIASAMSLERSISKSLQDIGYQTVEIDREGYVSGKMLKLFTKNET